jgi:hypothetical protein
MGAVEQHRSSGLSSAKGLPSMHKNDGKAPGLAMAQVSPGVRRSHAGR